MLDEKHIFSPHHWGECETGKFPPEKPRYTMTEEVEHTAREMRNTIDRLLRFEERLKNEISERMSHITSDNVVFKNTFAESHRQFLEAVKNEVNTFEANVDASIALFKHDIESNYATLSEDVYTQLNDKYVEYVNKLNDYKQELNATYDGIRKEVETRIAENNGELGKLYANFTSTINRKIADMQKTISDAVYYMKTNIAETLGAEIARMRDNGELENIVNEELQLHVANDYYNVNPSSDLTSVINYCFNNKKTFYVPRGVTIAIDSTLDLTDIDVDIRGTIRVNHNGIGIIVGGYNNQTRNIYIHEVESPNYKDGDISVRVVGVKRAKVTIDYAPTIQLYVNGDVDGQNSIAYSVFNVLSCRKFMLYDEPNTTSQGWINENTFNVERVTELLSIEGNTYQHNNNVFYKPCVEGGRLILSNCRRNKFYNLRNENMKEITLDSNTWQNVIIYNYHTEMMYNRGTGFTDNGRDNVVESEVWQNNRYVPICCVTAKSHKNNEHVLETPTSYNILGSVITPNSTYATAISLTIPAKYINRIRVLSDGAQIQTRVRLEDTDGQAIYSGGKYGGITYNNPVFYYGVADSKLVVTEDYINPQTSATAQTIDILNKLAFNIKLIVKTTTTAPFTHITVLAGCDERNTPYLEHLKYVYHTEEEMGG